MALHHVFSTGMTPQRAPYNVFLHTGPLYTTIYHVLSSIQEFCFAGFLYASYFPTWGHWGVIVVKVCQVLQQHCIQVNSKHLRQGATNANVLRIYIAPLIKLNASPHTVQWNTGHGDELCYMMVVCSVIQHKLCYLLFFPVFLQHPVCRHCGLHQAGQ